MAKFTSFFLVLLISTIKSSKSYALTFNDIKLEINEAFYQYEMVAKGYMKLGDVELIYIIVPVILILIILAIVISVVEGLAEFVGAIIGGSLVGIYYSAEYLTDLCINKLSDFDEDQEFREKALRTLLLIVFFCLILLVIIAIFYALILFIF